MNVLAYQQKCLDANKYIQTSMYIKSSFILFLPISYPFFHLQE